MSILVKICGNTCLEDACAAAEAGADAVGFVFYPKSPRCVEPQTVREIVRRLPAGLKTVGVFVNESAEQVRKTATAAGLSAVQLAGAESPELCAALAAAFEVIKVFHVGEGFDASALRAYRVSAFLFDTPSADTPSANHGGSGKTFDWKLLRGLRPQLRDHTPFYLAGGLRPENVATAIAEVSPDGVDVCSGVEVSPGHKDDEAVRRFIRAARATAGQGNL